MKTDTPNVEEYYNQQDSLLNTLTYLASFGTYVFRGYNKQDNLLPLLIREKDYSGVEFELLNEFEKYGSHYFSADSPIDFISYGQHYGLPTRLLDFTFNPFIALSFALFSKKSPGNYKEVEDRSYYYIRYCDIGEHIHLKGLPVFQGLSFGSYESDFISSRCRRILSEYSTFLSKPISGVFQDYVKGLSACAYNSDSDNGNTITQKIQGQKLCFIDPNQSNQRIIMQQGLFMLPYTLDPVVHQKIITNNTSVIKIHRDLRESLLKYLDTLGFNTFRLMPDLSSICAAVTQRVKDSRAAKSELFKKK
ncbi:FRG domain-containing protein [Oscillospiraceae bacterium WX1]